MPVANDVSVIIPTLALRERAALIWRAVESVLGQHGVRALPIVVINGQQRDPELVQRLRDDTRLRTFDHPIADLPGALRIGRRHVDGAWFTALDDDDVMLPGALATRVHALSNGDEFDAVVTSGFCRSDEGDTLSIGDVERVARDPLGELVRLNWMLPGSWLCPNDTESRTLFDAMPPHLECTYLAIVLCTTRRVRFLATPTVVWHRDSPIAASRSMGYRTGQAASIRRLMELDLPSGVRDAYRKKLAAAYHDAARAWLEGGDLSQAWRQHFMSLRSSGGWRHLPFTRRLIFSGL